MVEEMSSRVKVSIPFVQPVFVRIVLDCLNSRGIRPSVVLESAGLTWQDLCNGGDLVDLGIFRRFVAHALRCSGEPALGLLAGSMLQPYHSPVGIAAVSSETLGQSLEFVSRYAALIFGNVDFQLDNGPVWSTLKVRPLLPLCEIQVFFIQCVLGAYCRLLEEIIGGPVDDLVVGLPYPRPAGNDVACLRYVRKVEFDQECLTFQLPVALLRTPCSSVNRNAFLEAAQACQRLELELGGDSFVQRVRRALMERLSSNPGIGELASVLGLTARALGRKLTQANCAFSEIKDELRRTHAAWYLQHTELSVEAIAAQLGYKDPTNFTRKFKDWYRMAPSKMRQSLRTSGWGDGDRAPRLAAMGA